MLDTIVFLPGTLTDERIWTNQTSLFPHSVVINLRLQDSLQKMMDEILRVKSERVHLIGFSMGGYIAQEFSVHYPEKVASLTAIGSSAMGYPPEEKELVVKTMPLINPKSFKGITDKRMKEYLHPHSYENEEIKHLIRDMAGSDAAQVYLRQLKATLDRRVLVDELAKQEFPIRFIAGEDDHIVKLDSIKKSHEMIPGSELFIIKECGHFIPLEKPEELNTILTSI